VWIIAVTGVTGGLLMFGYLAAFDPFTSSTVLKKEKGRQVKSGCHACENGPKTGRERAMKIFRHQPIF
jgi:hypothetical protein